ncbi:MAG TPA: Dna2/Cas4 domain-containing protein, partial [Clostridiales bacterium]|nr:Dna2/Cas4 domain-containing protein [Clostridiales bacterium]
MDITVNIRSIQHYMYCPRRYALLEVNNDWAENAFVVKANIMHENVHDGSHSFSDSNKIVRSAVSIYNDELEYDLYGITDCIEFVKSANGTFIEELSGKYDVRIV